jgi:hypothetical protein
MAGIISHGKRIYFWLKTKIYNVVFFIGTREPEGNTHKELIYSVETPKRRRTVSTSLYEIFTDELGDRVVGGGERGELLLWWWVVRGVTPPDPNPRYHRIESAEPEFIKVYRAQDRCRTGPPGWKSIPGLLKRFTNSGIFEQNMGVKKNRLGTGLSNRSAKLHRWRAGTTTRFLLGS